VPALGPLGRKTRNQAEEGQVYCSSRNEGRTGQNGVLGRKKRTGGGNLTSEMA